MLRSLLGGFKSLVAPSSSGPDFVERRKLVRLRCHYEVTIVRADESAKKPAGQKKAKGVVVEMGLEGMRLRCFEPVKKGTIIDVHYAVPILQADVSTIRCEVCWSRQRDKDFVTFAGVKYISNKAEMSKSWVKALLHELGFKPELIHQRRRHFRSDCFIPAQYVSRAGDTHQSKVYNLGVSGALIECAKELAKDELVDLRIGPYEELPQFGLQATVVQCRRQPGSKLFQAGLQFKDINSKHAKYLSDYLKLLMEQSWCE